MQRIQLTNDTASLCFPPTLSTAANSITSVYVACQPNVILAFQPAVQSTPLFSVRPMSNVLLPANSFGRNATYVPQWDQKVDLITSNGLLVLLAGGSGALFSLSAVTGQQVRQQLGPYSADLFGTTRAVAKVQPLVISATSSNVVFVAATGSDQGGVSGALYRFSMPSTPAAAWAIAPGATSYSFGNTTYPTVDFTTMVGSASVAGGQGARAYFLVTLTNLLNQAQASELWWFASEASAAVHFPADALVQSRESTPSNVRGPVFQESGDGAYLLPTGLASASGMSLPLLSAFDGSLVQAWALPASLPQSPYFSMPVLLDPSAGGLLYMAAAGGMLAVASFEPHRTELDFVWSFQSFQIRGPDHLPLYLDFLPLQGAHSLFVLPGLGNHTDSAQQSLLVYSSFTPDPATALPADAADMLSSFSSVPATRCGALYQGFMPPTSEQLCTYCDTARGSITARTCAYCVSSTNCTSLPLGGDLSATCADPGYPLSVDVACMASDASAGGPASDTVAIIVGVAVGLIVAVSIAICWMAKRPAAAAADSYQNI